MVLPALQEKIISPPSKRGIPASLRSNGNGKTISATATAKVGSNKITIETKKLTKGKTYVLQDCYYGGWLDSKKGGNKKISFKAK